MNISIEKDTNIWILKFSSPSATNQRNQPVYQSINKIWLIFKKINSELLLFTHNRITVEN